MKIYPRVKNSKEKLKLLEKWRIKHCIKNTWILSAIDELKKEWENENTSK